MISLDCFACRSKITAPDQAAGRSGKCPKCGALILFPSPNVNLHVAPPADPKPEIKSQKFKKKKLPKKEPSRFPVYMACGTLGLVAVLGIASWIGMSFYLEQHRASQLEEQDLAQLKRKRSQDESQNSFLEAKQKLDEANLKIRQKKQEQDQAALEELDRQNREIKQKREQTAEQAAKEFKERSEQQAKEIQDKEKAIEQEKRREAERKRQQEMIEEDHKTILAYGKIHIKSNIKDMLWSPPLRAISVNKKEGLLYRLQGVVGQNRKPVSYYFFVVNREVVQHQQAKNNSAVTICQIVGDLETP